MEKFTPKPDQETTIEAVLRDKSHLSGSLGGFGKTLVGVESIIRSGSNLTLIICPLKVIRNWEKTLQRQAGKSVKIISSKKKQERLNYLDLTEGEPGVYIVGWEFFRTLHWGHVKLDMVIADEVHRACNRNSKTFKMLLTTAHATYKLGLSATPAGNHLSGLWAIRKWLWPKETKAYWPWITDHFCTQINYFSQAKEPTVEREVGAVWAGLPSVTRFKPAPGEVITHEIEVELSAVQKKAYKEFEQDAITFLGDHPMVADLPSIMHLRLRQMCLGVPMISYDDEGFEHVDFDVDCKSSKIDAAAEILSDLYAAGPVPVLIFCHSRKFVKAIVHQLNKRGYSAVDFVGGQSEEEVEHKISGFGTEHQIIVATIAAIGEGVDGLQDVCSNEIWFSLDDNRVLNRQARWRLDRPGQKNAVNRYLIRAADTVEVKQIGRIKSDDDLLDASIDGEDWSNLSDAEFTRRAVMHDAMAMSGFYSTDEDDEYLDD